MERFRAWFGDLADPRTGNAQRHDLLEILLIALCATLCGAETCVDMALFGEAKERFLRRFLRLPGGIPIDRRRRSIRPRRGRGQEAAEGYVLAPLSAARSERLRGLLRTVRGGLRDADRRGGGGRWQDRPTHVRSQSGRLALASDQRPSGAFGTGCLADGSSAPRSMELRTAPRPRPAQGRRAQQRDRGVARAARPPEARRLHRHRRRDALPEGHRPGDPRSGRRLCPGPQGEPTGAAE